MKTESINNTNTKTTTTTTNSSPISQSKGESRTQDPIDFTKNNIPLTNYDIASIDTSKPVQLSNEERLKPVLSIIEKVLQIYKKASSGDDSGAVDILFLQGKAFRCQGNELINNLSSLLCFEKALKIGLLLDPPNYTSLSQIYFELGNVYKDLQDINKAFACFKIAYFLSKQSSILSKIDSLHLNLKGIDLYHTPSCIILPYGEIDHKLALLKQKIQTALLDPLAKAVEQGYGWSYISSITHIEWGVKGYIDWDYVEKILTGLGELGENKKNVELAQMLCFEAMNLAILKLTTKPYDIVRNFTKDYPDLIKQIENKHPEFFVDGKIVYECQCEMHEYTLFKDTKYSLTL
ncbi:MAG: hypothetical protein C5B43_04065 [Verrucomicrobia bacterium]|nr:MAG: hypothetical protein C5B43_04065 [Verrucomicrobiota bacterium]